MPRPVTVGFDGSRESLAAVEWAAEEARLRRLPLRLLHVWDIAPDVHTPLIGPETRRHWSESIPREAAERVRKDHPELRVDTAQRCGDPAETLSRAAQDSELLVVGSRGLGAFTGFMVGSVAQSVVAHSEQPVVLVRAARTGTATPAATAPVPTDGRVVLGIDTARPCDEVLDFAFAHADRHGVALQAVHSWHFPPLYGPESAAAVAALQGAVAAAREGALAEVLEPWQNKYPDVAVTRECRIGHPVPDLLEAARGAGLVVVGRRNQRSRFGAHIGSVTHAVLHHCSAPVAVVPHD
ncbi:universal stress protein [Streptomyces sp. NPDC047718]|uniref:universal stress protein n=1 Tax=Streptomyces sp. NPDC047718 TaxID=3155479 RepID=UPI0034087EDA